MRGRIPLILLGVLVLLSAYIYFVDIRGKVRREARETRSKSLLAFGKEDILKIEVKRPSGAFACVRSGKEDWQIVSPVEDRADQPAMDLFASSLADLKKEGEIQDTMRLADYGLAVPEAAVMVAFQSGAADTLIFGGKSPTGSSVYVRRPRENRVLFTNTGAEAHYSKTVFDLRDKSVLPYKEGEVEGIRIESRGRITTLSRTNGAWTFTGPLKGAADGSAVESFLNQIKWAQAKEYADERPESVRAYGLVRPMQSVTLTLGAEKSQKTLSIGNARGRDRYYAKDASRPPVFMVDSSLVREFNKTAFDFADKKIAYFETDSVRSVAVDYADRPSLVCRRDTADQWLMESPKKSRVVAYKINSILNDVRDMLARDYLGEKTAGLAAYGLAKPKMKVTFRDKRGRVLVELKIADSAGQKRVYVMNTTTGAVYRTDALYIGNMKPDIGELIEKSVGVPETQTKTH